MQLTGRLRLAHLRVAAVVAVLGTMGLPQGAAAQTATVELELSYDQLGRVKTVRDANAVAENDQEHVSKFYPAGIGFGGHRNALGGRVQITYDTDDRPIIQSDELNRVSTTVYDALGRVTQRTYPELNKVEFEYDPRSNIKKVRQIAKPVPVGQTQPDPIVVEAWWHTQWNKPVWIKDARGNQTDYVYVASGGGAGEIQSVTLPNAGAGRGVYAYTYNGVGQRLTKTDPTNVVVQNTYQNGFLRTTTVDPNALSLKITFTNNAAGDVTAVDGPRSDVVDVATTNYDLFRRKVLELEPDPGSGKRVAVKTTYDPYRGVVLETAKGFVSGGNFTPAIVENYQYDLVGNRVRTITPAGLTQASFDELNRPVCTAIRQNLAAYATLPSDPCVPTPVGPNGPDRISRTTYDDAGQVTSVVLGYSRFLDRGEMATFASYTYTPNGQRATVVDANGNLTQLEYDGFDRLKRQRFPVTARGAGQASTIDYEEYDYDPAGNRTSFRRRNGETIAFEYDELNQLEIKDMPTTSRPDVPANAQRDIYYLYDLAGRMTAARFVSTSGPGVTYEYDTAGRRTQEATFGRAVTSQLNQAGQRKHIALSDGFSVSSDYNAAGGMKGLWPDGQACPGAGAIVCFTYDDLGRRKKLTRANGGFADYEYDLAGRLNLLRQAGGVSQPVSLQTMTYSPASQALSVTQANQNYVWKGRPPAEPEATHNGLNQIASIAAVNGGYDAAGNLTRDSVRRFVYDTENRLVWAAVAPTLSSPALVLEYDPLGRLAKTTAGSTVTEFLYDGDRLVGEYGGDDEPLRRYVHGDGVDEPLAWYDGAHYGWFHADRQGSIIATSNDTGQVTSYAYGPWGEPIDWTGPRFRYTGQAVLPEVQAYHYKARVYDPGLGRFLQTDPIGYDADLNLYAYVRGDPVNRNDPTGEADVYHRPDGSIVIVQTFTFKDPTGKSTLTPQAIATAASSVLSGKTSSGQPVTVVVKEGGGKDSISVVVNPKLNDSSPNGAERSHIDKLGGKNVEVSKEISAEGVGHEIGHGIGAGDQYKGGVGVSGKVLKEDPTPNAPSNLMRNGGGQANQQTVDEMVGAKTNRQHQCKVNDPCP